VNLVKLKMSIAIMLMIVDSTLSKIGSGQRSTVPATNGFGPLGGCNPLGHIELLKWGSNVAA